MSFRKRNVVLSASSPGENPARRPQQPSGRSPAVGERKARSPLAREAVPNLPVRSAGNGTVPSATLPPRRQPLPAPTWPVASRPVLSPETRARLEPEKRRLQAVLLQQRRQRHRNDTVPSLGPGARPSPFDGRPITSTGTASLDALLAGYGGLLLGHSLLVEEQGTTDFGSVVLRAYAAEGLVQGHHVHVLGFGHGWRNELPGLAAPSSSSSSSSSASSKPTGTTDANDKLKIAWRYEALAPRPNTGASPRGSSQGSAGPGPSALPTFCHTFDLTKRLAPADTKGSLHPFLLPNPLKRSPAPEHEHSPLRKFLHAVKASLDATPPTSIHRIVMPSLLAPTLYAMDGWSFSYLLSLFNGLRSMLRAYARRLTVAISLPTSLYERHNYYVRQLERLCDNVVELVPLPPGPPSAAMPKDGGSGGSSSSSRSKGSDGHGSDKVAADKMQGWLKVHKVQIYSDMGGAGASPQGTSVRENLCFSVSGSKGFLVAPYSLPPIDDDNHKEKSPASTVKDGLDF
ncbi:elongator complex protein 4 [Niveomyces insectorum RCEF 264]|uniref:Elongator complex protein 4 n=1 Tax=Niveomyces insectorum RCEF 264 TaxID=1081102 RepID=A0A168A7L0_9HYPO|nr:elongator complex protein 4 [Niveomyces insectorum RCEF 264]